MAVTRETLQIVSSKRDAIIIIIVGSLKARNVYMRALRQEVTLTPPTTDSQSVRKLDHTSEVQIHKILIICCFFLHFERLNHKFRHQVKGE